MIRYASAPVSWGIQEFGPGTMPYGEVLDQIAEAGYPGVELGPYGYLPTEPGLLRSELEQRGLQLLSAFLPVDFLRHAEEAVETALQVGRLLAGLGAHTLVLADDNGKIPELVERAGQRQGSYLTPIQWDRYARGVDLVAARVRAELELDVVFHHHGAGCVETPEETRELLSRSSVGLCLDTGHWHFGGGDAVSCIQEYRERIRYVHLKDFRRVPGSYFEAVRKGTFCALGQGEVNFASVLAQLRSLGYQGWAVVEQDILEVGDPEAPLRYAKGNLEFLEEL